MFLGAPEPLPRANAVSWFDIDNIAKGEQSWNVDSSPEALAAYQDVCNDANNLGQLSLVGNRPGLLDYTTFNSGSTNSTTRTTTLPTGLDPLRDQILIINVQTGGNRDTRPLTPSGWAEKTFAGDGMTGAEATPSGHITIFWKRVTGTETAPTLQTANGATTAWVGAVELWDNVDATAPFAEAAVVGGWAGTGTAYVASVDIPALETVNNDALIYYAIGTRLAGGPTQFTSVTGPLGK